MYGSATRTTAPRWESTSLAAATCSSAAWAPAQIPAMPSWTIAGALGMARTTGTPCATRLSIAAVGMAAATDSTVCSGESDEPISASSVSKSWGLTAITTTPAPATASAFESVASIPWRSRSSAARSSRRAVATISDGSRQPVERRPASSASPIFPQPRMAMRRASIVMRESLGSRPQRDESAAVAGQHVHARQPGPLAVGLEQLGRLPALHPAAAHGRQELDQTEVAHEPALVAAEPLQTDDACRPGAEPALLLEPARDRLGGQVAQPFEVERSAEADERGGPAGVEAEGPKLGGREARERLPGGRRMKSVQALRRCPHDPALDRACPLRLDQLLAERAQKGMGDRGQAQGAKAARHAQGPPEQRVVAEAEQDEASFALRAEDEPPVGRLPRLRALEPAVDLQRRAEHSVAEAPGGVAHRPRRQRERVRATGHHERLDHGSQTKGLSRRRATL